MAKKAENPAQRASGVRPEGAPFEVIWRQRFQEFAAECDDDAGIAGWSPTGLQARLRRFAAVWQSGPRGQLWLDAGCGAGTYTRHLVAHGASVVGIDYSLPTILKARARSPRTIYYAVADVRYLPFRPESFDGALCFGVVQALAEVTPALSQLAAQVSPFGQVWVDGLNRWCAVHLWDSFRRKLRRRPVHLRYDSPKTIKRLMMSCGLVGVTLYWVPIAPRRWQWLQAKLERPAAQWFFANVPFVGFIFCHAFIVSGHRPAWPQP